MAEQDGDKASPQPPEADPVSKTAEESSPNDPELPPAGKDSNRTTKLIALGALSIALFFVVRSQGLIPERHVLEPPEILADVLDEPHRRGAFTASLPERSPLSTIEQVLERSKWLPSQVLGSPSRGQYKPEYESYSIHVPDNYDPNASYGLIVWISARPQGRLPQAWSEILEKHRLIWIGANDAGNPRKSWFRHMLAFDAVHNMKKFYSIDESRVYVSGISGGGRIASALAVLYPELFHGGLYIIGANYFKPFRTNRGPYAPGFAPPSDENFDLIRARNQYVFLTGDNDFNRAEVHAVHDQYLRDGFEHVIFLQVPEMGHTLPPAPWFEKGIEALEGPAPGA